MIMNNELCYYSPGDIVTVRHDVPNKMVGWVIEKVTRNIRNKDTEEYENIFLGIKCRWFDKNGALQEAIFNTKDICLVDN